MDKDFIANILLVILAISLTILLIGTIYMEYKTSENEIKERSLAVTESKVQNATDKLNIKDNDTFMYIGFPKNRVDNKNFTFYSDKVCINFDNLVIGSYELKPSGSMYPMLYEGAEIIVEKVSENDIQKGDIVSYKDNEGKLILHRVVEVNSDSSGKFYIVKGDNNPVIDHYKVRYENIVGIVVAITY